MSSAGPSISTSGKADIRRSLVVGAYVVLFWVVLPALLLGSARLVDARLSIKLGFGGPRVVLGVLLGVVSGYLLARSVMDFRRYGATLPISALPPRRIIQQGLYTQWRHPIYLFYTLVFAALGLITGSTGLLLVVLPTFVILELLYIWLEERTLVRRFGADYERYRLRTPLVVPRLAAAIRPVFFLFARVFFSFEIRNRDRVPVEPPFFVIATHRNYLDPVFIDCAVRFPTCYVTTYELFRTPLLRFVFRRFLCIPKRRYLNDHAAARELVRRLREGFAIGVFPEGERSWTGAASTWKPEALALLRRYPGVPIVPMRLDGNYHCWPRWADRFRRGRVTLTVQEPFLITRDMSPEETERELRTRIEPDDSRATCRSRKRTGDITRVLYRCPVCRSFRAMTLASGTEFRCRDCSTRFHLEPDYTVRYHLADHEVSTTLPELYGQIRIRAAELAPSSMESSLAAADRVTLWRERGDRIERVGDGRLQLSRRSLCFTSDARSVDILLRSVRSVTTESNRKLQIYEAESERLWQVTFESESVLKWQDYLVEVIGREYGHVPNRR